MRTHKLLVAPLRSGLYSVSFGELVLRPSREPLLSSARELLVLGLASPEDELCLTRDGERVDLKGLVGVLAKLTVVENERVGPVFKSYRNRVATLQL